uniref:C-type lectin domain-containing protein n=1 Tax=Acrobeloides nanus TaxID=290746 RepID=A0A914C7I6_9BILA
MKLLLALIVLIFSSQNSQVVSLALSTTPATSVPCPANSTGFNNVCYRAVNTTATWINAAIDCISQGGNLASVSSDFVNDFIVNLAQQKFGNPTRFWLGGSSSMLSNGSWVWIDGNNMTYTNWAMGHPRNVSSYDSIQMHGPSGTWYDASREFMAPYVCEVPSVGTANQCYDNWYYLAATNKCYRVITKKNTFLNQRSSCYSFDGDLVSIHSTGENFFVGALASKAFNNTYQELFIGLKYTSSKWSWVDETPYNWWPNKWNLTNLGSYNYYGLIETGTTTNQFSWDYDSSSSTYPAICDSDPSFLKKEKKIVN